VGKLTRFNCLVDFNVPLLLLLESLEPFIVVDVLACGNSLEHILDSRHHSLKTTEVDVGTVFELGENFISVFLDLVLDVHLSSLGVHLFTRQSIVDTEVVRVVLLGELEFVIVKKSIRVGNTKEQPGFSLVCAGGRGVFGEKTTDESTVRGNSGSGGNHDEIGLRVFFRHEHNLSRRSSHGDLGTRGGVAKEVGADSLLDWVISLQFRAPVGGTTDTKGSGLSGHVISVTRGGDGVKTDRVVLFGTCFLSRGDDTPRLSLPVRHITFMVDDDVASLSGSLRSNNTLGRDNLSGERGLDLEGVHRNILLVIVRLGLEEILGGDLGAKEKIEKKNFGNHIVRSAVWCELINYIDCTIASCVSSFIRGARQ
jgi:hypothetical protein